jgi:hypothetical protein
MMVKKITFGLRELPGRPALAGLRALPSLPALAGLGVLFALAVTMQAQKAAEGFGPLDAAPPEGVTVAEIIERMGKRESAFAEARNDYTFRQDVKFNTISDDTGRADGEYHQVTDISFDGTGKRVEHVIFAPQNTIQRVIMTENDMKDIENKLPFVLTAPEVPEYDISYLGRQKVDELDTYVFDVKPKKFEKGKRYFQGTVWVDQQDDEIVLINGMTVPQDVRPGHEDLSPPYTTYYQQIDDKYWFPTYTKAEGTLHFAAQHGALSQEVRVRTTVHYSGYKRFRTSVTLFYGDQVVPSKPDAPETAPPPPPQKPPQ